MAIYAIGDIQGCYTELRRLLDRLRFDPGRDQLWFVGDLVNRGPQSLEVLRFVMGLGERAISVLGNHDLHLLALAAGNLRQAEKSNLGPVLRAPDREELLYWLRCRPLAHYDPKRNFLLIHAGLPPQWDLLQTLSCAKEVEKQLQGSKSRAFLRQLYDNTPDRWSPSLKGMNRLRFIVNCFTRLRYCAPDGTLALREKGPVGSQNPGYVPWFTLPRRLTRNQRILFGHWSTLGYYAGENVWCLDSGCVWGRQLTAVRVRKRKAPVPISLTCTDRA